MSFKFSYNNQPVQQQGQVETQTTQTTQTPPQFDLSQTVQQEVPPQSTPDNYQINYDTVEQQASPQTQQPPQEQETLPQTQQASLQTTQAQDNTLNTNFGVAQQQTQTVKPNPVDTTTVNPQDVTLNVTPIENIQASPQNQQPPQEQPSLDYHTVTCDGVSVGLISNSIVDVTQLNSISKITYGKGKYKLDIPMGTQEINAKNYTLVQSYVASPVAFVNNILVLEITTLLTSQYNQIK